MISKKWVATVWFALTLVMISVLLMAWSPLSTKAGPQLPPRDTPTPTPRSDDDDRDEKPIGAYIELRAQGAQDGVWTVVQWQDSAGGWHDVEGWQGTPNKGQNMWWWVAQRDFGKGPFRWAIYQGQGGELLATSESFYLPGSADELVRVEVSLIP